MHYLMWFLLLFFFSSRRRHTRYIGDWSSDVCSSDLSDFEHALDLLRRAHGAAAGWAVGLAAGDLEVAGASALDRTVRERSEERRVGKESRSWGAAVLLHLISCSNRLHLRTIS